MNVTANASMSVIVRARERAVTANASMSVIVRARANVQLNEPKLTLYVGLCTVSGSSIEMFLKQLVPGVEQI